MDGRALRVSVVARTASILISERKGSRRGISRNCRGLSEKWSLAPARIAGDIERRRWPGSSPVPKPTVDRPLSLPTFRVDSMSNVVGGTESASAIRAVGVSLGPRSTAQAEGGCV
jgi:hypothetical protein